MRVSVVICTLDRADALAATLECLRHQHHEDFEVIVVNGPSTDRTLEVVDTWRDHIRYRENPQRNLSVSRNIGIRASVGDIVAFIDDDALPEPEWLTQALPAFVDPEVAGAGGIVFDHTGMDLQYRYAATDRFCRAVKSDRDFAAQCFPGTFQFPYLQGTNQIYRRGPLFDVGGFDENIFFYGDDSDICGRLIDAGWFIRQLVDSPVHHKYLPSGIRDHQRITTNWFPVVHDHTYFCMRHASAYFPEDEILHHVWGFIHTRIADTQWHEDAGRLPAGSWKFAEATCMRAFAEGYRVGREAIGRRLPRLVAEDVEFLKFPTLRHEARRKLVFVSSSYTGRLTGGIGRLFSDLAPAMAARGHDVRVITQATGPAAVDLEDSVWVHRVDVPALDDGEGVAPDVLPQINEFATAAVKELQRIRTWSEPDLVFAPLWDLEGIGVLRETDLPVAVHVSTPVAVTGPLAGYLRNDGTDAPELRRVLELEAEVLDTADLFQANTVAVTQTILANYDVECGGDRWQVVNIGLKDRSADAAAGDSDDAGTEAAASGQTVFFVGRFEARKGIDTLLGAMERILPDYPEVRLVLAGEDRALGPKTEPIGALWRKRHRFALWIDRVTMLGEVDDATLHRAYAGADVVVLPSRYESFGLVMVEAMMHGKALVSTDASGVREVVRNGTDGVLVDPGNVDELEKAIRSLLDDPVQAAMLGNAARQRFLSYYASEHVAERFEEHWRRLAVASTRVDCPLPKHALAGDAASIDLRGTTAATLIVRGDSEPARIRVIDSAERVIELTGGERRRIRLDVMSQRATVSVEEGAAIIDQLVTIDGGTGA